MSTAMYSAQSTPEELLHAFIDDELDTELEQQFYTLLASDSDLRSRLRQLRAIRGETRRFGAFTAPSQELTGAVFSRLGFVPAQTAHRNVFGAALLLRSAWSPVASAAAAAAITAMLIFGLSDQPKDATLPRLAENNVQTNTPSETPVILQQTESINQTPAAPARMQSRNLEQNPAGSAAMVPSADRGNTDRGNTGRVPGDEVRTANPVTLAEVRRAQPSDDVAAAPTASYVEVPDLWASADVDQDANANTSGANPLDANPLAANPAGANSSGGTNSTAAILASQGFPGSGMHSQEAVDTRKYFPLLDGGPGLQHVSVELRGVSAASFPNVTIGSRSQPWMENMSVALYYSDEQDDFGLEFGQEAFSQHYHGVEYGKVVRYEQNLLTSWLLAGYRHRFEPWRMFGSVEPYFSAGFGSTMQAWPLARAGAGFMYMPDRRVRFQIGLEGTLLAYPYQDTWFTSKRAGLTYGISVLL
jgi:hypothetical protein